MSYNDLRKGRASQNGTAYHITVVTQNRLPHFASLYNGRKVVQQLMALQDQGMAETLCYVLMPDHLHRLRFCKMARCPASYACSKAAPPAPSDKPSGRPIISTTPSGKMKTCRKWRATS